MLPFGCLPPPLFIASNGLVSIQREVLIRNIINNLIHSSVYSNGSLVLINLYSVCLTFAI